MKQADLAQHLGYKKDELLELASIKKIEIPEDIDPISKSMIEGIIPPRRKLKKENPELLDEIDKRIKERKDREKEEKEKKIEATAGEPRVKKPRKPRAPRLPKEKVEGGEAVKTKDEGEKKKRGRPPKKKVETIVQNIVETLEDVPKKPQIRIVDISQEDTSGPVKIDKHQKPGKKQGQEKLVRVIGGYEFFEASEKETGKKGKIQPKGRHGESDTGIVRVRFKKQRQETRRIEYRPVQQKKYSIKVPIRVYDFSQEIGIKITNIVAKLRGLGVANASQDSVLDETSVSMLADEFKKTVEIVTTKKLEDQIASKTEDARLVSRSPIVTVMGHVDHGKTSLLDYIRKSNVAAGEAGGITQKIGAYRVKHGNAFITFIDTPGHHAFTSIRSRGASVTDIVVLVVAGDEGVMPQTEEAIAHAKAAQVKIVVAMNKSDKKDFNGDRLKNQISQLGLIPEEWGGETLCIPVSAVTGDGVDKLLESILLQAEMMELKADPTQRGTGFVLESRKTDDRGNVATVIVKNGTITKGDRYVCGTLLGRVRAIFSDTGDQLDAAGPAMPIEISGLEDVPQAGELFQIAPSVEFARKLVEERKRKEQTAQVQKPKHTTLESLFKSVQKGDTKELRVLIKADAQGSVEAIEKELTNAESQEVGLKILHKGVGVITEADVMLADSSDGIILGFNTSVHPRAETSAKDAGVQVLTFKILYELVDTIKASMVGLLEPQKVEEKTATVEVRKSFPVRNRQIAGCYVLDGTVSRSDRARVIRSGTVVFNGKIESLRRFKDDVKTVDKGFECGIILAGFSEVKEGDTLEIYTIKEVPAKLTPKAKS